MATRFKTGLKRFSRNSSAVSQGCDHGSKIGVYVVKRHWSNNFRVGLGVMSLTLSATFAPAQTPAPNGATLAAVSAHLRAVDTMTASFSQTDARGAVLSGLLSMKRPGRIRFEYQKGVPILLVGDGKALVFIDYQVKQVQRWPITNTPLGVLLDPNRDLARFAKIIPNADPKIVLVETRDPKHPEYGVITLAFYRSDSAPGGLMLQGWVALDGQNKRTIIRLGGQKFNVPISDQAFTWRDPRIKTRGR
jgi:outer membrane lipoprotein-sorting protein